RRYDTYFNFAVHFNKTMTFKKIQWDLDRVHETFECMLESNLPVSSKSLKENGFSSLFNILKNEYGTVSLVYPKLVFYNEYLHNRLHLPIEEINFIINTSLGKKTTASRVDEESIKLANHIVEKFRLHNL